MNARSWQRVKRAFAAATEADADDRDRLIELHCEDDEAARRQTMRMLKYADDATSPPTTVGAGQRIGDYEIVEAISAGASAVVYRAVRDGEAAAVKVLRLSEASERARRRFEYEGEVLAALDHPAIASVFDVGSASSPLGAIPFIAMELVDGRPIDDYAAHNKLDDEARVSLMLQVCDAVAYAHRRGVIHRDLKPANILVNDMGQPKVLDFGIARSVMHEITATSLATQSGDILGTPGYMSPEQCAGASATVDTRSDVYSLGVILYELLAGSRLHDLEGVPLLAALDVLRRAEAPLIGSVRPDMRGPLEDILAKAMHRDPRRRYDSAAPLAEDLRRAVRGDAVSAESTAAQERMRRALRQHRRLLAALAASVVVIVLAGAAAFSSMRESRSRDIVLERSLDIVYSDKLSVAVSSLEALERAYPHADLSPKAQYMLWDRIGGSFSAFDRPELTAELYGKALDAAIVWLGRDDHRTIRSLQVYTEALAMTGSAPLAARAEALIEEELARWSFTPESLATGADKTENQRLLRLAMTRGEAIARQGRHAEAIAYLERVHAAQAGFLVGGADHSDARETRQMINDILALSEPGG